MSDGRAGPGPEVQTPAPTPNINPQSQENIVKQESPIPNDRNLEFLGGSFDGLKWRELPSSREGLVNEYINVYRTYMRLEGLEDLYPEEEWKKE